MKTNKFSCFFSVLCYVLISATFLINTELSKANELSSSTVLPKEKVVIQKDPLGITSKKLADSEDLLRRISESADKDKDLSSLTKKVLSEAARTSPGEFKGLSIQLYDQSVNSGTAIKELNNAKEYNEALNAAIKSVNELVKSAEELQSSKDAFDVAVKGKDGFRNEFNKMKASIDHQNEQIAELRNDNLQLRAKIQDLKSSENDMQSAPLKTPSNNGSPISTNELASPRSENNNLAIPSPPFRVSLVSVPNKPSNGDSGLASSANIILDDGTHLDINTGYISNGYKVVNISTDGVRVIPLVGDGPALLIPVN